MTATYGMSLASVSTLDDVIANIVALLAAADPGVDVRIGDGHNMAEGAPPRIRIVVGEDGEMGGPLEIGAREVASFTERATFYVWGDSTVADVDHPRAAKGLCARLVNAIKASAPGRIKGAQMRRATDTKIAKYGEEYRLLVTYAWGVPYDDAVWAAAYAMAPADPPSPPDIDRPNGDTGQTFTVTPITTTDARP